MRLSKLKILIILFIIPFFAKAEIINIEEAERTARNLYFEKSEVKQNNIIFENIIPYKNNEGNIVFYIFDVKDDNGFVIISAEDAYSPIIAYSIKSIFKIEGMPENIKGLYDNYGKKITYVRNNNIKATEQIGNEWKKYNVPFINFKSGNSVKAELLTTAKWNQSGGFDDWCPYDDDGYPPVGCVATAMGIIMKYWNYPLQGTGNTSYYEYPYGTLSANFGESHYFWNLMDNDSSGNTFEAHVSYHCAVAVHMDFGLEGSGAYVYYGSNSALNALKNYFNYKTDLNYKHKSSYSDAAWKVLLKDEIDAGRPLLFRGYDPIPPGGGHAWVCDGYENTGTDRFHFNLGWGGSNNAYYDINNICGFTDDTGAIFNIEPDGDNTYQSAPENLSAQLNTGNLNNFTVDLTWDAPTGKALTNYKIYRIDYDAESFNHIYEEITTVDASTTSYTDVADEVSDKDYLVQAIYSDGEGEAVSDYVKGMFDITFRVHDNVGNFLTSNGINCQVTFNGETNATGFGNAYFNQVPFGGNKIWIGSADGHPTTSGKVDVIEDESFNIYLDGSQANISTVENDLITVYPNPVKDILYVKMSNNIQAVTIEISDIAGKQLDKITIDSNDSMIDVSDLPNGFYFFKFNFDKETIVKKIIIE
ncbi:MAG: C10 family peptidase [Bacteroidales bacterium]|nr:C10 family peptidase [Bacteroidales bacterium]